MRFHTISEISGYISKWYIMILCIVCIKFQYLSIFAVTKRPCGPMLRLLLSEWNIGQSNCHNVGWINTNGGFNHLKSTNIVRETMYSNPVTRQCIVINTMAETFAVALTKKKLSPVGTPASSNSLIARLWLVCLLRFNWLRTIFLSQRCLKPITKTRTNFSR